VPVGLLPMTVAVKVTVLPAVAGLAEDSSDATCAGVSDGLTDSIRNAIPTM
jgi:hypothetical protein